MRIKTVSNPLAAFASVLLKGLLEWVAPLISYFSGRRSKVAERDKNDAEILKRQRDNNVTTVSDADSLWVRLRKDYDI
jgi:hypothetical protein